MSLRQPIPTWLPTLALPYPLHDLDWQRKSGVNRLQAGPSHQRQPCNAEKCVVDVHLVLRPIADAAAVFVLQQSRAATGAPASSCRKLHHSPRARLCHSPPGNRE